MHAKWAILWMQNHTLILAERKRAIAGMKMKTED